MSELNEEKIKHLSRLCRIAIADSDLPLIAQHLQQVLNYIEQLQEVDVSHLAPYSHLETQEITHLREDEVKNQLPRDLLLANAPESIGGMIRVPPIIQK